MRRRQPLRINQFRPQRDKLGGRGISFRKIGKRAAKPIFDADVLALDPSCVLHFVAKCAKESVRNRIVRVRRQSDQHANMAHLVRWLRPHGIWPCDRGSTEHTEKFTPFHSAIPLSNRMVAAQGKSQQSTRRSKRREHRFRDVGGAVAAAEFHRLDSVRKNLVDRALDALAGFRRAFDAMLVGKPVQHHRH